MANISYIEDRLKSSAKPQKKSLFSKKIGPQSRKLTLVPRENKLLIEILNDEKRFLRIELMNYKRGENYLENDSGIIDVAKVEEIETEVFIFDSVLEKIKNAFGLDFLHKLTLRELDNLAGVVEQMMTNLDFDEIYNRKRVDKKLKSEVTNVYDIIMSHYREVNNISELNMFEF